MEEEDRGRGEDQKDTNLNNNCVQTLLFSIKLCRGVNDAVVWIDDKWQSNCNNTYSAKQYQSLMMPKE